MSQRLSYVLDVLEVPIRSNTGSNSGCCRRRLVLDQQGVDLNLNALLVFAAVIGFSGSLISLAISKWTAKRLTGAQVIDQPHNATEAWLVDTVQYQAQRAGIGMPEVAIYDAPDMNAFATGMNRNKALVAVSTGLLYNMNQDEVEAVLGHEISHVANNKDNARRIRFGQNIQGIVNDGYPVDFYQAFWR